MGSGVGRNRHGGAVPPAGTSPGARRFRPSLRLRARGGAGRRAFRFMSATDAGGRRAAREAALQMLYQWEIGRNGAHEAIVTYWPAREPEAQLTETLRDFANALVRDPIARVAEIDALITAHAQKCRLAQQAVIDRLILRLGVYELLAEPGTPPKVVINEAIELARSYTGDEAVGFVNGVLDAVRKQLGRES